MSRDSLKYAAKITGLFLILLSASSTASAGSREDELISMKVEAHASLDTYRSLKEWCEGKYPETTALAASVGLYIYPRIAKVEGYLFSSERNPKFRQFAEQKLKNGFMEGRKKDIAHFESKYTQLTCENALNHVLKTGIGSKLESFVDVER